MQKKRKRLQQIRALVLFGAVLTLLLIVIVSNVGKNRELGTPQKIMLELLGSAQAGITHITSYFSGIWSEYLAILDTRRENGRLREELLKFKAINNQYREAVATNVRLRKLLELKETLPAPTVTAEIIGRDPSIWFDTIIIDRGSSDGVQRGMPAVTVEGIVGQVINVAPHFAKILLANDPNSATDVLVQETRAQGIVKGTGGDTLELHYVLKSSKVNAGDHIVTSGLGGVFPKGLAVGEVLEVLENPAGMFQQISITPAVDFSQLEMVIIILEKNPLAE